MDHVRLGNSDLTITRIGFGAWAIGGGGWAFAWGPQDDSLSIATIHDALNLGINWIDTAAVYGLGHSEEVVAAALKGMKDQPYVFTKCGRVWDEQRQIGKRLKRESVRLELEQSLRRLQRETIDLYQVHWPEPDEDIEEAWEELARQQAAGKIRWIGVSNFNVEQMSRVSAIAPITSLQPTYSLVRREIEADILPYCEQQNIGVIVYSPMASGLLTGAWTRERIAALPDDDWRKTKNLQYQEPLLTRNLALATKLQEIAARHGHAAGTAAIAWTLRHSAVTAAIVGARKPGQLAELVPAAEWRLLSSELAEIDEFMIGHMGQ